MGSDLRKLRTLTPLVAPAERGSANGRHDADGDLFWMRALWPAAVLFHLAANGSHLLSMDSIGLLQLGMALVAAAQLIRPSDGGAGLLAGLYLGVLWLKLPVVGNHEVVLGLTSLGVLISLLLARRTTAGSWPAVFAPAGRVLLLVAYGFMAFSKLNSGFFDPAVSCAVVFAGDVLGSLGPLRSPGLVLAVTIAAVELVIPLLLVGSRLRGRGVALAMAFHFVLALDPVSHVWDFSAVLFPLFLLFAPGQVQHRVNRLVRRVGAFPVRQQMLLAAVLIGGQATTMVMASRLGTPPWLVAYPLWLVIGGLVLLIAVRGVHEPAGVPVAARRSAASSFRMAPALGVVVLIAALNGIGPYTELRSAAAFNMYSNLQIAEGRSNHFIVGAVGSSEGRQQYLEIADAVGDPLLGYYLDNRLALPAQNLDRYLQDHPELDPIVVGVGHVGEGEAPRSARTLGYGRPGEDRGLFDGAEAHLRYKLGFHRAIDASGSDRCLRSWGPLG